MHDALTVVVIPALIGILATLLTIFLTPSLQHYFWKRQRRAELQLATINEVVRVTSEFSTMFMMGGAQGAPREAILVIIQSLHAANAQVRALFSLDTALAYGKLLVMIQPTISKDLAEGRVSIKEFIETRNAALYALYTEAGIIPRDKHMPRVFEQLLSQHKKERLEKAVKVPTSREPPKTPRESQ